MTDIASLGIEVKTDSVKKAADDLDNLNQKGKESEGAADKAGDAWSKAAAKISGDTGQIIKELQQLNARQDAAAQTFTKISTQIENASGAFQSAALAIGKFRDESSKVSTTATAVAPAVEKTTTVIEHQSDALTALAAKIDPLISAFGRLDFSALSTQISSASTSFQTAAFSIERYREELSKTATASTQIPANTAKVTKAVKDESDALAELLGRIDPVVGALGRLDDMEQQLRKHASTGLLPKDDFDEYAKKIQAMRDGLAGSDDQLKKTGVSAAQTAAALRMLPAQFTDIFTQLAGGANPLLVLIQQGGQIKDSFGGIGNTFDVLGGKVKSFFGSLTGFNTAGVTALGGALSEIAKQQENIAENSDSAIDRISGTAESVNNLSEAADTVKGAATGVTSSTAAMVGGFLAAAAALAALAVAYKQGSDEQTAYSKALILTGNAAGVTTDQLADLARQVGSETGTIHDAADALTQFAATGKFASSQLGELATAALNFEDATGKAVSETVKEFARLADDPVKASQQLNEQYHYLTAAVYEQIAALQEQGRTNDAAQVAEKAYAEALDDRATKVKESLGTIETAWNAVKSAAKSAWDAVLDIGREATLDERIKQLRDRLAEVAAAGSSGPQGRARFQLGLGGGGEGDSRQELAFLEQQKQTQEAIAKAQGLYAEEQKKGVDAQREVDAIEKQFLTNAQKRNKEVAEYKRLLDDIRRANPNDSRLNESTVAKNIANIEAKYKDPKTPKTKAFRDDAGERMLLQLKQEEASLQTQLLGENKLTDAQKKRAEFEQLIADLKEKKVLTADQKSLLASQDAIKAQLSKNVAVAEEVRLHNESLQMQERVRQLQATIASSQDNRQEQYQRQLDAFGMGKEQLERVRSQATIFREFQRYQSQLDKATPKDLLGSDEYAEAAAKIKVGLNEALAANEDYYDKLDKKRGDWANGAKESFADYLDSAKDVAGQTYDLFSNALKGTEDALVEFVRTGKLSFSDLANSIIEDLVRIQVRKAIAFGVESFQGSSLFSSIFGGAQNVGSAASAAGYSTAGYAGAYGFDGGGYTGDLPRMGGVDGKGGFMAILHPQETVIDHTKPSRTQGGNSTSNVFHINVSGDGSERERKQAGATIGREINRVIQRSARFS
ncbi:phage tail tape measure protein [Pseudomonas pseudonitroreducens]|uniref:phage tail tape measure protein n=1 Tax=Pseudomonas pseudonitroreducens TaxID=2892326 RepID=UPI001F377F77|nr:phage tail tape measure protein [Pseudomonas pseudonitroreducens]